MRYISLSEISSLSKSKPDGFLAEAFRLGVKRDNCLVFEDDDYEAIRNFSGANTNVKPEISPVQEEKVSSLDVAPEVESSNTEEVVENNLDKEPPAYKHSAEKQARIGRGRITSI